MVYTRGYELKSFEPCISALNVVSGGLGKLAKTFG